MAKLKAQLRKTAQPGLSSAAPSASEGSVQQSIAASVTPMPEASPPPVPVTEAVAPILQSDSSATGVKRSGYIELVAQPTREKLKANPMLRKKIKKPSASTAQISAALLGGQPLPDAVDQPAAPVDHLPNTFQQGQGSQPEAGVSANIRSQTNLSSQPTANILRGHHISAEQLSDGVRFQRSVPAAVRLPAVLTPANPSQAPDNPSTTPGNPMPTPADPSQTPANPSQTPSSPHQAPSDPRRRKRAIPAETHSQSTEASLSHAATDTATAAKQPTGGFADAGTAPAQREVETSGHQTDSQPAIYIAAAAAAAAAAMPALSKISSPKNASKHGPSLERKKRVRSKSLVDAASLQLPHSGGSTFSRSTTNASSQLTSASHARSSADAAAGKPAVEAEQAAALTASEQNSEAAKPSGSCSSFQQISPSSVKQEHSLPPQSTRSDQQPAASPSPQQKLPASGSGMSHTTVALYAQQLPAAAFDMHPAPVKAQAASGSEQTALGTRSAKLDPEAAAGKPKLEEQLSEAGPCHSGETKPTQLRGRSAEPRGAAFPAVSSQTFPPTPPNELLAPMSEANVKLLYLQRRRVLQLWPAHDALTAACPRSRLQCLLPAEADGSGGGLFPGSFVRIRVAPDPSDTCHKTELCRVLAAHGKADDPGRQLYCLSRDGDEAGLRPEELSNSDFEPDCTAELALLHVSSHAASMWGMTVPQVAHLKHRLSKGLKWAEAHSTEQLGEASRAAALAAAMQGMLSEPSAEELAEVDQKLLDPAYLQLLQGIMAEAKAQHGVQLPHPPAKANAGVSASSSAAQAGARKVPTTPVKQQQDLEEELGSPAVPALPAGESAFDLPPHALGLEASAAAAGAASGAQLQEASRAAHVPAESSQLSQPGILGLTTGAGVAAAAGGNSAEAAAEPQVYSQELWEGVHRHGPAWKDQLCHNCLSGCPWGEMCKHAHSQAEQRSWQANWPVAQKLLEARKQQEAQLQQQAWEASQHASYSQPVHDYATQQYVYPQHGAQYNAQYGVQYSAPYPANPNVQPASQALPIKEAVQQPGPTEDAAEPEAAPGTSPKAAAQPAAEGEQAVHISDLVPYDDGDAAGSPLPVEHQQQQPWDAKPGNADPGSAEAASASQGEADLVVYGPAPNPEGRQLTAAERRCAFLKKGRALNFQEEEGARLFREKMSGQIALKAKSGSAAKPNAVLPFEPSSISKRPPSASLTINIRKSAESSPDEAQKEGTPPPDWPPNREGTLQPDEPPAAEAEEEEGKAAKPSQLAAPVLPFTLEPSPGPEGDPALPTVAPTEAPTDPSAAPSQAKPTLPMPPARKLPMPPALPAKTGKPVTGLELPKRNSSKGLDIKLSRTDFLKQSSPAAGEQLSAAELKPQEAVQAPGQVMIAELKPDAAEQKSKAAGQQADRKDKMLPSRLRSEPQSASQPSQKDSPPPARPPASRPSASRGDERPSSSRGAERPPSSRGRTPPRDRGTERGSSGIVLCHERGWLGAKRDRSRSRSRSRSRGRHASPRRNSRRDDRRKRSRSRSRSRSSSGGRRARSRSRGRHRRRSPAKQAKRARSPAAARQLPPRASSYAKASKSSHPSSAGIAAEQKADDSSSAQQDEGQQSEQKAADSPSAQLDEASRQLPAAADSMPQATDSLLHQHMQPAAAAVQPSTPAAIQPALLQLSTKLQADADPQSLQQLPHSVPAARPSTPANVITPAAAVLIEPQQAQPPSASLALHQQYTAGLPVQQQPAASGAAAATPIASASTAQQTPQQLVAASAQSGGVQNAAQPPPNPSGEPPAPADGSQEQQLWEGGLTCRFAAAEKELQTHATARSFTCPEPQQAWQHAGLPAVSLPAQIKALEAVGISPEAWESELAPRWDGRVLQLLNAPLPIPGKLTVAANAKRRRAKLDFGTICTRLKEQQWALKADLQLGGAAAAQLLIFNSMDLLEPILDALPEEVLDALTSLQESIQDFEDSPLAIAVLPPGSAPVSQLHTAAAAATAAVHRPSQAVQLLAAPAQQQLAVAQPMLTEEALMMSQPIMMSQQPRVQVAEQVPAQHAALSAQHTSISADHALPAFLQAAGPAEAAMQAPPPPPPGDPNLLLTRAPPAIPTGGPSAPPPPPEAPTTTPITLLLQQQPLPTTDAAPQAAQEVKLEQASPGLRSEKKHRSRRGSTSRWGPDDHMATDGEATAIKDEPGGSFPAAAHQEQAEAMQIDAQAAPEPAENAMKGNGALRLGLGSGPELNRQLRAGGIDDTALGIGIDMPGMLSIPPAAAAVVDPNPQPLATLRQPQAPWHGPLDTPVKPAAAQLHAEAVRPDTPPQPLEQALDAAGDHAMQNERYLPSGDRWQADAAADSRPAASHHQERDGSRRVSSSRASIPPSSGTRRFVEYRGRDPPPPSHAGRANVPRIKVTLARQVFNRLITMYNRGELHRDDLDDDALDYLSKQHTEHQAEIVDELARALPAKGSVSGLLVSLINSVSRSSRRQW